MSHEFHSGLARMAHSPLTNYIIPGLTSSLIGGNGHGTVRLFECSRDHQENITPHSHRFDFQCLVLCGVVTNITWTRAEDDNPEGDEFAITRLTYEGEPGSTSKLFPLPVASMPTHRPTARASGTA